MKVIITIPAYNEEKNIGNVIKSIKETMNKERYEWKILVVNDGSKDKTANIAKKEGAIVVSHPVNYGLAETFKTEMKKCIELNANIIVHVDADGQYDANQISKMIKEVKMGYDLVLGSRFRGYIESMPLVKRLGNIAFSRVISKIIRQKISDSQTGFRAFTQQVAKIPLTSDHTYTQEQIIRVAKSKLRIKEIPINFLVRGGNTKSRLMKSPFDYAIKAWINLLRIYRDYEPLKFFGYVGGFLILIGILLGVWILVNIYMSGTAGGIPRVILSALTLITGLQILLFGFLADMTKK